MTEDRIIGEIAGKLIAAATSGGASDEFHEIERAVQADTGDPVRIRP